MKGALALQNEAMIDALRECIGLEPLYSKRAPSKLWDAMPVHHGNQQTRVTALSNGPRKVPPIRGEKVSLRNEIVNTAGVDRFLRRGLW